MMSAACARRWVLVEFGHETVEPLLRDDTGRSKELGSQIGETLDNIDGHMHSDLKRQTSRMTEK